MCTDCWGSVDPHPKGCVQTAGGLDAPFTHPQKYLFTLEGSPPPPPHRGKVRMIWFLVVGGDVKKRGRCHARCRMLDVRYISDKCKCKCDMTYVDF